MNLQIKNGECLGNVHTVVYEEDGFVCTQVFTENENAQIYSKAVNGKVIFNSLDFPLKKEHSCFSDKKTKVENNEEYVNTEEDEIVRLYIVPTNKIYMKEKILIFDNEKAANECSNFYNSSYQIIPRKYEDIENDKIIKKKEINVVSYKHNECVKYVLFNKGTDARDYVLSRENDQDITIQDTLLYQKIYQSFTPSIQDTNEESGYPRFLGVGSAFNPSQGNTSCYFKIEDKLILVDCGSDVFPKIKKIIDKNKDITKLYVMITHLHSDHVGSLSSLIEYWYYVKNTKVNLIYPEPVELAHILESNLLKNNMYEFWLTSGRDKDDTYVIPFSCYDYSMKIKPIKLIHSIYNQIYSFGYIVQYKSKSFIFVWDTCDVHPEIFRIFNELINEPATNYELGYNEKREIFLFHDTCLLDCAGNAHTNYYKLINIFEENRDKIFFVHMDNKDKLDEIAKENEFGNINNFI